MSAARTGVGADVNVAQGNLDLNVFGNKIDVDQGIRDAWAGSPAASARLSVALSISTNICNS